MPKSRHLRDFIAIAGSRSLRSAALSLGLTQPAISRSLQELEEELGVPLVERHAKGVRLTLAGEKFFVRAKIATESVRRGLEEARQFQGDPNGSIAISLSSAPVLGLLPHAYPIFRKAWPEVSLRFIEGQFHTIEPRLRNGELDFYAGPRPDRSMGSGYTVQQLCTNERVVMARRGHPLAKAKTLSNLIGAEWLIAGLRDKAEEEFEEVFSAHGLLSPAVRTRAESMLVLMALLATTDAIAFLPRIWATTLLFQDTLQSLDIKEKLAAPDIVQMHSSRFPLTPAAEHLSLLLQRAAGKLFG
jgi:LysR family transcriptional regulator, regulator of abg operon